jgi:DNA repair exonuclease SbcCD nuclease subunit
MRELKFIHTSDLHIGGTFKGLSHLPNHLLKIIQDAPMKALVNIVDNAIKNEIDFLLISGDVFDNPYPSPKHQYLFVKQMERLNENKIKVYICKGNHDGNIGRWLSLEMPINVYIFRDDEVNEYIFEKDGNKIASIQGFSYSSNSNFNRMANNFRRNTDVHYNIALYHGSKEGDNTHAPYAPFSISELLNKHFDYWALGHIHKCTILCNDPFIIYPGSPQGLSIKETGIKGSYLVQFKENQTNVEFIKTNAISWVKEQIKIDENNTLREITTKIEFLRADILLKEKMSLVEIEFLYGNVSDFINNDDFIDMIYEVYNREIISGTNFSHLVSVNFIKDSSILNTSDDFINELIKTAEEINDIEEIVRPIFQKTFKYIKNESLDNDAILEDAKRLIQQLK